MILAAFGVPDISPSHISMELHLLKMSHTYVSRQSQIEIDGLSTAQPVWPIIFDSIDSIKRARLTRDRYVFFVCDSGAALSYTNLSQALWPENRSFSLPDSIKHALIHASTEQTDWKLELKEPRLVEYVKVAVKPSFINHIQAIIQKITPYAKSKETRMMCIAYLAGGIGIMALRRYLKASLKLADLLALMDSPAALNMKNAVAALKSKPIEVVTQEFGVESFELLYIIKSYQQHKVDIK
jgi:hypothetical protein